MSIAELNSFLASELIRAEKLHGSRHKDGFLSRDEFAKWFVEKEAQQKCQCYYCGTSIFDIRRLIAAGKLKIRRTGTGEREPVLELDRLINGKDIFRIIAFCLVIIAIMIRVIYLMRKHTKSISVQGVMPILKIF